MAELAPPPPEFPPPDEELELLDEPPLDERDELLEEDDEPELLGEPPWLDEPPELDVIGWVLLVGSVSPAHPAARAAGAVTSNSSMLRRFGRSSSLRFSIG